MVTYYLNLTYANVARARWEKEYRLTETFRVPDGSHTSMNMVLDRMTQESCILQKYYDLNSVSYDLSACDANCRIDHVCAARAVGAEEYDKCVKDGAPLTGLFVTMLPVIFAILSITWTSL